MDHSFAGRLPVGRLGRLGRLTRPLAPPHPRLAAGVRARRARLALLGAVAALALLAVGWLWLRDSPLVSVEHVRVSGLQGPEGAAIEAALVHAARGMSTLDVRTGALRAAVAGFPVVRDVHASASFPHSVKITVGEQPPVADLAVGNAHTAVAADGVVLGPALLSSALPTLQVAYAPATGARVRDATLLASLEVLGAAPAPLARLVSGVSQTARGLTVTMRNGLLVYFGDAGRPHAKWLSLARVLSDSSSSGATYVDVRLPARPAAGFAAGGGASASANGSGHGSSEQGASSANTIAALAAALSGGSGQSTATGSESGGATAGSGSSAGAGSSSGSSSASGVASEASGEKGSEGGASGASGEGGAPSSTSESEPPQG